MKFHDTWVAAKVCRTEDITPTIRLFELEPPLPAQPWSPGSHLRVHVNVDGRQELRHYSLIDTGRDDGRYRIAVKLMEDGQGGSRYMWSLRPGDALQISDPDNNFDLSLNADSYTLVAGGVGITPMVSMARFLVRTQRPVRFFYAVRTREEAAFAELLQSWLGDRLELCIGSETGRLDFANIVRKISAGGELCVCGPIGMLEAARRAWSEAGHPMGLLRYESFASSGHYANQAFTVVLPREGREIQVSAHQTLLAALEEAGIDAMFDCRRGECGLCAVDILACDSVVDHRDVFLSEKQKAENRRICTCVSRAVGGRIEIDTAYRGAARTTAESQAAV